MGKMKAKVEARERYEEALRLVKDLGLNPAKLIAYAWLIDMKSDCEEFNSECEDKSDRMTFDEFVLAEQESLREDSGYRFDHVEDELSDLDSVRKEVGM